jgi:hypothetical protein
VTEATTRCNLLTDVLAPIYQQPGGFHSWELGLCAQT